MISCKSYLFDDDGTIPNNSLPLVVYPQVLTEKQTKSKICKELLASHNWTGSWVDGIYPYHHYHSTAHEVLAVLAGSADVKFGGKQGKQIPIQAGDVVVIPAGVGHCRKSSTSDFRIVGAYAGGRDWDLCTGDPGERPEVLQNIKALPIPEMDPVSGKKDPLYQHWS